MTVAYPRKLNNTIGARDILKQVVRDRELHLITLNRYRYSEQRSCKDLTDVIEKLDGQPRELVRDLSHHISDEARHAYWLTDLLIELDAKEGYSINALAGGFKGSERRSHFASSL